MREAGLLESRFGVLLLVLAAMSVVFAWADFTSGYFCYSIALLGGSIWMLASAILNRSVKWHWIATILLACSAWGVMQLAAGFTVYTFSTVTESVSWLAGATVFCLSLNCRQWKVDVLTTDPQCQAAMTELGAGIVNLDAIWRSIRPFRDLCGLCKLWRYLLSHPYDIVHTHTSKAGFVGRIAARLAGAPVVLHTTHGFAFHEGTSAKETAFYAAIERIAGWFCDAIVTVSHYHRDWAGRLRIAPPRKLRAIPNGISEARIVPSSPPGSFRQRIGAALDCLVIVSHGRLAADKGLEYLVAAAARVKGAIGRPSKFVLVGDGAQREELTALADRLGVSECVIFDGFQSDIGSILAGADLVVLPSLREGLSISLLEAMAAGKSIIATNIGGNLEATAHGECALTVRTRDADGLAEAIEYLSGNPQRARAIGEAAKARFLAVYRQSQMLDAYETLYQELLTKLAPSKVILEEHAGEMQS